MSTTSVVARKSDQLRKMGFGTGAMYSLMMTEHGHDLKVITFVAKDDGGGGNGRQGRGSMARCRRWWKEAQPGAHQARP